MDEQERLIAGAKPGDTLSYVELEGRAPAVGTRMTIFAVRDALTGRIVSGHRERRRAVGGHRRRAGWG